jgi:hypothetical protein
MRPDIELQLGAQTVHIDVSNTDAHASSLRSHALKSRDGAIVLRENKKIFKYKSATDLLCNPSFVPVIFDQYGDMGLQMNDFLKAFARYIRDNCLIDTPKELMSSLYDSLSCIVVRENAKMILDHLSIMSGNIVNGKFSADQPARSRKKRALKPVARKRANAVKRAASTVNLIRNKRKSAAPRPAMLAAMLAARRTKSAILP